VFEIGACLGPSPAADLSTDFIPLGSTNLTGDARPYRYKFNPACNPSGSAVVHLPSQGA
jgi:hypothetical protein